MRDYSLGFISNDDIYNHVKETVEQYRTIIDLQEFNRNLIDPIKLTFDAKVYGMSFEDVIQTESVRQIDKTNTNKIGYFHQNIFRYAPQGWVVPEQGWDVVNEQQHMYVELKNKHNTMNSASSQKTYMKMQAKILEDDQACCMLAEVIANRSQNIKWTVSVDGRSFSHERIRRISIDKFYELVFNDATAFMRLCKALPDILDDVLEEMQRGHIQSSVYSELNLISTDTFKSLYLLAFRTYEGFDDFIR
jgi:hypothetical protein